MTTTSSQARDLALTPLGAGDLIDRSVRFYRKNFGTFVLIAAPPVVAGIVFSMAWMMLGRSLFNVANADPSEALFYQLFIRLGDVIIWFIQVVAILVVMGGASRNFVRHLLFAEAMTFRETYRNVRSRLFGLAAVSVLLTVALGILAVIIFYVSLVAGILGTALVVFLFNQLAFLTIVLSVLVWIASLSSGIWLFFLVVSRFAYVPQVMLVEGRSAFAAIGRSASLAGKNVKRITALNLFTIFAIYSALSLLYVPLSIAAWANGVPFFTIDAADTLPAWFEISSQVIFQGSLILIIPILLIGLCLLYVDERSKKEGYDIELLAAARLGEMPSVPPEFVNPLTPALSVSTEEHPKPAPGKQGILGLD